MTGQEAAKLMAVMSKGTYRNSFKGLDQANVKALTREWAATFKNVPYEVVEKGYYAFVATDTRDYQDQHAPTPGQINAIIQKTLNPPVNIDDLWQEVRQALKNAYSYPKAAFEKLSPMAQKGVGSYQTLKQWSVTEEKILESFKKREFYKRVEGYNEAKVFGEMTAISTDKEAGAFLSELNQRMIGNG